MAQERKKLTVPLNCNVFLSNNNNNKIMIIITITIVIIIIIFHDIWMNFLLTNLMTL